MAGPVCKAAMNGAIIGLTQAVERILTDPNIHQNKIPDAARADLIQEMADLDIATYRGLAGILSRLQTEYDLISDDVWMILRRPGIKQ